MINRKIFCKSCPRLSLILPSSESPSNYAKLYPQNGDRIVTIDSVTSLSIACTHMQCASTEFRRCRVRTRRRKSPTLTARATMAQRLWESGTRRSSRAPRISNARPPAKSTTSQPSSHRTKGGPVAEWLACWTQAQRMRSLGLGYKRCAVIPVAGQRTHGSTFQAL